jgi:uncharacterized protein (UPF0332 family)
MEERTWEEMSLARLRAAKALLEAGFYRDSISRSYYAAYCAAASCVSDQRNSFAHGFRNPSHEQLPQLILNAGKLPVTKRRRLNSLLRVLRRAREDAVYRPYVSVTRSFALFSLINATAFVELLGI